MSVRTILNHRHFSLGLGTAFFVIMAAIPSLLTAAGAPGGGIAQLDVLNKIGISAALALSLNLILCSTKECHINLKNICTYIF